MIRQHRTSLWAATAFALTLGAAPATQAAPHSCPALDTGRMTADAATVQEVQADAQLRRYDGIRDHIRELEAIMRRAPATPEAMAACGPTDWTDTPYPYAAFLLGVVLVEDQKMDRAAETLLQGLMMAPKDPMLAAEGSHALTMLGRNDQALAIADRALASSDPLEPLIKARLLRARGFALIELARLDEAEAAYNESLRLEPGSSAAANELEYIRNLRAGAKPTEPVSVPNGG